MIFNSWGYIFIFLLFAIPVYWRIPESYRIFYLCFFSLLFYSLWKWEFSFLMVFSATVDYIAGKAIFESQDLARRKLYLALSVAINIGLLLYFKYLFFFYQNASFLMSVVGIQFPPFAFNIILPLGISFYTFQSLSYSIDVYRREIKPTNNFIDFLTFVTFWPQLIAGPILRAADFLPQLIEKKTNLKFNDISEGIRLILNGLFKKVICADLISGVVDESFRMNPAEFSAFDVWVSAFLFGFQIYFDFSGYSDIAIGSARLLGFKLPENFNWPYFATSPKDFWKRWHISLSSWIRDYVYLPLANMNFLKRISGSSLNAMTYSLFITWFIMGLWHGASWNFAFWGVYHSFFVFVFRKFKMLQDICERQKIIGWMLMLFIAMAGWIPFRALTFVNSLQMFSTILNPFKYNLFLQKTPAKHYYIALLLVIGMIFSFGLHYVNQNFKIPKIVYSTVSFFAYSLGTLLILIYLKPVSQFIYFQF